MESFRYPIKRPIDVIVSLLAILFLLPIMLLIAIFVWLYHGRPLIYVQERPGLNGQIFSMYKFRTMTNQLDAYGNLLPPEQRVTKFGRMLRKTSLDELPELFNVLRGNMSLVGPRPLLIQYLSLYAPEQARRHEVQPGMTGWAQINGRNGITWEEKFSLDVWYVDNISLYLDLKIILKTLWKVFKRENIGFEGADYFRGSNNHN